MLDMAESTVFLVLEVFVFLRRIYRFWGRDGLLLG
jgi:hypothetical protein